MRNEQEILYKLKGLETRLGALETQEPNLPFSFSSSAVVFNESGADVDFRVESNTNTNMLFVDAGNDRVGIGKTPSYPLDVNGNTAITGYLGVGSTATPTTGYGINVHASTSAAGGLVLGIYSTAEADDANSVYGYLGRGLVNRGASNHTNFVVGVSGRAEITATTSGDVTAMGGLIGEVYHRGSGTLGTGYSIVLNQTNLLGAGSVTNNYGLYVNSFNAGTNNYSIYTNAGDVVFNGGNADSDLRVGAVGQANALFVQGSDGYVGVGTGTPLGLFDVKGSLGSTYIEDNGIRLVMTRNSANYIQTGDPAGYLVFSDNTNATRAYINSTGLHVAKSLAVGATPVSNYAARVNGATSAGQSQVINAYMGVDTDDYVYGMLFAPTVDLGATNYTKQIFGIEARPSTKTGYSGDMTSTSIAFQGQFYHYGTGNIVGARLFQANNAYVPNGGTIGTQYGFFCGNLTAGTNNYSIYTGTGDVRLMSSASDKMGLWGKTPVVQPTSAVYGTWTTLANVVTALKAIGILGT